MASKVLYINEARYEDLIPIPGVGDATAKHILNKREELGSFSEENFPIEFKSKQVEAYFADLISKGLLSFKPKPLELVMRKYVDWNAAEMQMNMAQTKVSSDLCDLFTDYQQQSQKYLDSMKTTVDSMRKDVN